MQGRTRQKQHIERESKQNAGKHRINQGNERTYRWLSYGKVEFCLTKLQALRATSSTFASLRLIDVLNAFGLFAGPSEYLAQDRGRRGVAESRDQMVQGAPVSTGAEPILADASVAFATVTESSLTDFGWAAQRIQ